MTRFILSLVFLVTSSLGFATSPALTSDEGMIEVQKVSLANGELTINVADKEPVTSVCHFYLARMEYIKSIQVLNLEFDSRKPCLNDQYGKRQGVLKWKIPSTVASADALQLIINGQSNGKLKFEGGKVSYRKH